MTALEAIAKIREVLLQRPSIGYVRGKHWTASGEVLDLCDEVLIQHSKEICSDKTEQAEASNRLPLCAAAPDACELQPYVLKELYSLADRCASLNREGRYLDAAAVKYMLAKMGVDITKLGIEPPDPGQCGL